MTPITSFEMAVEHYSNEANQSPEISLLDVMKADSLFLTTRRGGHLRFARTSLLGALDQTLRLLQAIENDGGDKDSRFYVGSDDLAQLQYDKKVMLSIYNNLNGRYHPILVVIRRVEWYSLEPVKTTLVYILIVRFEIVGPSI